MKLHSVGICLTLFLTLAACNEDIFIDKMDITTDVRSIDWDGGVSTITINGQPIDGAKLTIIRKVNGMAEAMNDISIYQHISRNNTNVNLENELFKAKFEMSVDGNCIKLDVDHNYYPDTIYIQADIQSAYEAGETVVTIMPSPGFIPGEIEYTLDNWFSEDRKYIAKAYTVINGSDDPIIHKIYSKGQVVATRIGWFMPHFVEASENIFGREADFTLKTVNYDDIHYNHSSDGQALRYSYTKQPIENNPLVCDEDKTIEVAPWSICNITVWIASEDEGFSYMLPAINPKTDNTIMIEGIYWTSIPKSFEIKTE